MDHLSPGDGWMVEPWPSERSLKISSLSIPRRKHSMAAPVPAMSLSGHLRCCSAHPCSLHPGPRAPGDRFSLLQHGQRVLKGQGRQQAGGLKPVSCQNALLGLLEHGPERLRSGSEPLGCLSPALLHDEHLEVLGLPGLATPGPWRAPSRDFPSSFSSTNKSLLSFSPKEIILVFSVETELL